MDFCNKTMGIFELIGNILNLFKLFIPLIIICYATFDFAKAITSKEEKELTKSTKRVIFRIIAAILIYFLPIIINYIFGIIGVEKSDCLKCVLNTSVCESLKKESSSSQTDINNEKCTINNENCISNAIFNG